MGGSRDALRVVHAVVRNHALRRELLAFLLFMSAEWATWVAMLVFAFNRGGASAAGFVAVIQLIPAIFVAPLGSVLGDRLPRARALRIGFLVQASALAATAIALYVEAPIWLIYVCAAAGASSITLTRPIHNAILPELAETPRELTASNSVSGMLMGVAVFTGPIAAAVMLQLGSPALVYAVMAVSQVVAYLLTLRLPVHVLRAVRKTEREPLLSGALGGFRAMRDEPGAAVLAGLAAAAHVVEGLFDVLVVGLALEALHLGQGGPGILTAGNGVGALIGAAATILLIGRQPLAPAIQVGILVSGVALGLVALAPNAPLAILLFAGSAVGLTFYDVAAKTLLQRTVDDEALARFFGVEEGLSMVGLAIGAALAPFLVTAFGIRGAFVAAGAFLPVLGLLAWGRIRSLDAHAHVPGPELELLRSIDLFEPLPPPILERLSWNLTPVEAKAGEAVVVEGDEGDRFFLITDGRATVSVEGRRLASLGPGSYFGEIALLRDVPRTATVTAEEPLRLLALERDEFLAAVTGSRPSIEAADTEIDRRLAEQRREAPRPEHRSPGEE